MTPTHESPIAMDEQVDADLDAIWRAHATAALRYATVRVGPHDAHDITVNAFVRISRSPGWSNVANPRTYLMRALANHAHDHRRQQERRWRRDLSAVNPTVAHADEPAIEIRRQIADLSVQQRAVIFLTYWEDLTVPVIAELLGLSTGTVHRTLTRARAQLRKALQ